MHNLETDVSYMNPEVTETSQLLMAVGGMTTESGDNVVLQPQIF